MYCPKCEQDREDLVKTKVVDSRLESHQIVRRRRMCKACEYRFTTWESLLSPDEIETNIVIRANIARKMIDKIKTQAVVILNTLK